MLILGQTEVAPTIIPNTFYKSAFESKKLKAGTIERSFEHLTSFVTEEDEDPNMAGNQRGDMIKIIQRFYKR